MLYALARGTKKWMRDDPSRRILAADHPDEEAICAAHLNCWVYSRFLPAVGWTWVHTPRRPPRDWKCSKKVAGRKRRPRG